MTRKVSLVTYDESSGYSMTVSELECTESLFCKMIASSQIIRHPSHPECSIGTEQMPFDSLYVHDVFADHINGVPLDTIISQGSSSTWDGNVSTNIIPSSTGLNIGTPVQTFNSVYSYNINATRVSSTSVSSTETVSTKTVITDNLYLNGGYFQVVKCETASFSTVQPVSFEKGIVPSESDSGAVVGTSTKRFSHGYFNDVDTTKITLRSSTGYMTVTQDALSSIGKMKYSSSVNGSKADLTTSTSPSSINHAFIQSLNGFEEIPFRQLIANALLTEGVGQLSVFTLVLGQLWSGDKRATFDNGTLIEPDVSILAGTGGYMVVKETNMGLSWYAKKSGANITYSTSVKSNYDSVDVKIPKGTVLPVSRLTYDSGVFFRNYKLDSKYEIGAQMSVKWLNKASIPNETKPSGTWKVIHDVAAQWPPHMPLNIIVLAVRVA